MYPEQILQTNLDEFSRCEEQTWLLSDDQNDHDPIKKTDAALEEKVNQAIWKNEILRVTENNEIEIHVKNGVVYSSGHLISSTNRDRVMKALQTVDNILGYHSKLVLDDELILQVAASLGKIEHRHHCKFFTGASHGVVVLNGEVSSVEQSKSAEQCAASHPNVRGVINYIRVLGTDTGLQNQRFLQPPIGREMSFRDGVTGIVQQVVIDPDNRLVIAMTIKGHIYDVPRNLDLTNDSSVLPAGQVMVIPMDVMGYLTNSSGFLTIKSTDSTSVQEYDSSNFTSPDAGWVPPYPYCPEDVLFPIAFRQAGKMAGIPNQAPAMRKTGEEVLGELLLANDSLGG